MYIMDKAQKANYIEALEYVKKARNTKDADSWRRYYAGYDYIVFDGGEVLHVDRPRIDSTIYYNDELPDPIGTNNKEDVFMAYNMQNFKDWGLALWQECRRNLAEFGCCGGWYVEKPYLMTGGPGPGGGECWPVFKDYGGVEENRNNYLITEKGYTRRDLTPEEVAAFTDIVDQLRENYKKRLNTYYKRYSNKIWSHGYWANR